MNDLDDDDAWNYSFPPSTDSLPLNSVPNKPINATDSTISQVPGDHTDKRDDPTYHKNSTIKLADGMASTDSLNAEIKSANPGSPIDVFSALATGQLEQEPAFEPHEEPVGPAPPEDDLAILNEHLLQVQALQGQISHQIDQYKRSQEIKDNESINSSDSTKDNKLPFLSQPSSTTSSHGPVDIKREGFSNGSASQSLNSLSLQSPFLKSSPANPLTTREDASSIMSNQGSKNALAQKDYLDSPKRTQGMLSNIRTGSATTINLDPSHKRTSTESDLRDLIDQDQENQSLNSNDNPKSPKIIQYRKSRRTTSEGNFQEILESTLQPREKYDTKLYVDEKFKDSRYRYATIKRNTEFHQLFRSLDLTDRLLDDFACALSREILLQGRIYVSEQYVCFNSSLLGWVTNLIIKQEDIIKFEKKNTAGIFPNGIAIETKDARHVFASFLSRDSTLDFMVAVWEGVTGKKMILEDDTSDKGTAGSKEGSGLGAEKSDEEKEIASYIMTIDEDSTKVSEMNANNMIDSDSEDQSPAPGAEEMEVIQFKADSGYTNVGPGSHSPTKVPEAFAIQDNEVELFNDTIPAPLGVVFELLIGNKDGKFFNKILESHGSDELNGYGPLEKNEEGLLCRSYTYKKSLGYSIGPKSTTCEVTETVRHLDYKEFIVFGSVTKTPDVPSGNSFFVNTVFRLSWGPDSTTNMQMSYYIDWVGKSWIRSVIEKSTLTGQTDGCHELIKILNAEIEQVCESVVKPITDKEEYTSKEENITAVESSLESSKPVAVAETKATKTDVGFAGNSSVMSVVSFVVIFVMVLILINQYLIMKRLSRIDTLLTIMLENSPIP